MNITRIPDDVWQNNRKYNKRRLPIRYIVLHTTGGTDSRGWLSKWNRKSPKSAQNEVSIHYLISRKGLIYQIVDDKNRAWHVGDCLMPDKETDGNSCSIGIEIEHLNEPDFPEAQLAALAELVKMLMDKYTIPGKFVVSHASVARPGPNIRKIDPVNFDWAAFWDRMLRK
jgi:N-acetylmuramoyl-L-alanine amidase